MISEAATRAGGLTLELEFLLEPNAEATVWLQGCYALSLGTGSAGAAPLADAMRAPDLWQRLRVGFQPPQFDRAGLKCLPRDQPGASLDVTDSIVRQHGRQEAAYAFCEGFQCGMRSATGESLLHPTAYYTLNPFPEVRARSQSTWAHTVLCITPVSPAASAPSASIRRAHWPTGRMPRATSTCSAAPAPAFNSTGQCCP